MGKYYTRSVCFKYIQVWFNNGVCRSTLCHFVPHLDFSPGQTEIIDAEISKLLSKGVTVNTTREPNNYVSTIFMRTKKDGSYRMILNLKTFNEFLKFKHCKLASIEDALVVFTEGCYFGSVDLKNAYYSITINENYQKYPKLFWKEEYYQYIVLPSGFSPAVRVFTNVLTPPFKYLWSKGHLSVKCIDDSLLLGETFDICLKNISCTLTGTKGQRTGTKNSYTAYAQCHPHGPVPR